MPKVLGLELAPLRIPLERRLQTAAVLQWVLSFLFLGFACMFFFVLLVFTRFYWIPLAYVAWYMYDRGRHQRGGRRSEWIRRWSVWRHFCNYFPLVLVKTVDLDPKKTYIFGCHPHGIFCASFFCHFATEGSGFAEKFPGIVPHLITLEGQFTFPLYREYFMMTGACGCSKESIKYILEKKGPGCAAMIPIGGAAEALEANPGTFTLNVNRRTGFVKLALETGASLVPVFSFGENDIFVQVSNPEGSRLKWLQQKLMQAFGFSMPVFHGRGVFNYTFGILPFRIPVHTVVGSPIDVPKVEQPGKDLVLEWHRKYLLALEALFEENKVKYGVDSSHKLHFI